MQPLHDWFLESNHKSIVIFRNANFIYFSRIFNFHFVGKNRSSMANITKHLEILFHVGIVFQIFPSFIGHMINVEYFLEVGMVKEFWIKCNKARRPLKQRLVSNNLWYLWPSGGPSYHFKYPWILNLATLYEENSKNYQTGYHNKYDNGINFGAKKCAIFTNYIHIIYWRPVLPPLTLRASWVYYTWSGNFLISY